ncbi:Membrane-bound O-acyltransferase gup1 [Linum perenne]
MRSKADIRMADRMGWKRKELAFLLLYAIAFYVFIIHRSLQLAQEHKSKLYGLRPGWLVPPRLNDLSDAQWRNFRGNLPILTAVFAIFAILANTLKALFSLRAKGMSITWLLISLAYLSYLHGACTVYILLIASVNFVIVMIFARTKYFSSAIWIFNLSVLLSNRLYEGYPFSMFGEQWAYLDNFRGTFRWHICFNFVILRMISFGYDYHWTNQEFHFDHKVIDKHQKHIQRCHVCKSGRMCYQLLQERSVQIDKFSFTVYLSYLVYAPLYLAGPIVSFNAFASQLDMPARIFATKDVFWYGLRWIFSFVIIEVFTHFFHYNAFVVSGLWKLLSPMDMFILGYGVLNFMWLKFFLIWRYFRLWSLINGIEVPENLPKCVNNCYNLESFWKNWHASFNRWLVRYIYIPLGGSGRKLLNVWVIFTFVAIWHDLEWKLLSWAWLTCLFFIPEMLVKSAMTNLQAESAFGELLFRELSAVAGAITVTCLMVANLVGYVIGPSGINWLVSKFLTREGLPVLAAMLVSFYIGVKLMFHIEDAKRKRQ